MNKKLSFKHDRDYFISSIEDGELAMKPFCKCGNHLNEDYYCELCQKQCLCTFVFCDGEEAYKKTMEFINKSTKFSTFQAEMLPKQ